MNKITKKFLIIIFIFVLLLIFTILTYQHFKAKPISTDNIVKGNIVPNFENNDDINENINDRTEENSVNNSNLFDDNQQLTPNETKAINLVKAEWTKKGEKTDEIQFNVSIQSNGKYLVTLYDIKTTRLIKGYIVDVETEIINEK